MSIRIKSMPDFVSGVFFLVIGLTVMVLAGQYSPGTAARMGPGYFPRVLGGVLALLALLIVAQSIMRATPEGHDDPFPLRSVVFSLIAIAVFWVLVGTVGKKGLTGLDIPVVVMLVFAFLASRELFWVLAGIAAFGWLLLPAGLVVASFALIFISAFGSHDFNWKETLISWAVLLALCIGVFVYGLKLQFDVWPAFVTSMLNR